MHGHGGRDPKLCPRPMQTPMRTRSPINVRIRTSQPTKPTNRLSSDSLVAMASSAYVRWRIIAGALVLGVFFVLAGASELANAVLLVEWAAAFNPARNMNQIWHWLLGADPLPGPGIAACVIAVSIMVAVLVAVLERKLRPVEVVS